jgi:hypothetical protein
MILVSALEDSFEIAWSFLEKSGELRGAAESANIILDSIEQQLRTGERRKLMLANRAISSYGAQVAKTHAVARTGTSYGYTDQTRVTGPQQDQHEPGS